MKEGLRWRIGLTLVVVVLALVYVLPSFQAQESSLGKVLPDSKISLGLGNRLMFKLTGLFMLAKRAHRLLYYILD